MVLTLTYYIKENLVHHLGNAIELGMRGVTGSAFDNV
jgi:hypothetical protein